MPYLEIKLTPEEVHKAIRNYAKVYYPQHSPVKSNIQIANNMIINATVHVEPIINEPNPFIKPKGAVL